MPNYLITLRNDATNRAERIVIMNVLNIKIAIGRACGQTGLARTQVVATKLLIEPPARFEQLSATAQLLECQRLAVETPSSSMRHHWQQLAVQIRAQWPTDAARLDSAVDSLRGG